MSPSFSEVACNLWELGNMHRQAEKALPSSSIIFTKVDASQLEQDSFPVGLSLAIATASDFW